jgi:hypothetical protein
MSFKSYIKEQPVTVFDINTDLNGIADKLSVLINELERIKEKAKDRKTQKVLGGADLSASIDKMISNLTNVTAPMIQNMISTANGMSTVTKLGQYGHME